ncbi:hypothetical protein M422DRAFT_781277 [Sphaerobolus stellatus SS14]|uniref:Uncharacterized protein n=1 Tax=Sphaerobolus stellatus (strain SS14) TaxID=990650 RepID=A0A0C9UVF5_SPHS4|nr:hypothetical protein M422DRAFT_781276 [Sphaerobolus stellatus SS14]KIJ38829.1 hypothetical protein M422DRAFT_781277 [Sphaerobolus stellatus SS14]
MPNRQQWMLAVVHCVRRATRPPVTRSSGQRAHPTPSLLTGPLYPRRTNSSSIASRHGCYFPPPSPTVVIGILDLAAAWSALHPSPEPWNLLVSKACYALRYFLAPRLTTCLPHGLLLGCIQFLRRRFNTSSTEISKKSPHTSSSFSASSDHCHDERKIADLMRRLAEDMVRLKH